MENDEVSRIFHWTFCRWHVHASAPSQSHAGWRPGQQTRTPNPQLRNQQETVSPCKCMHLRQPGTNRLKVWDLTSMDVRSETSPRTVATSDARLNSAGFISNASSTCKLQRPQAPPTYACAARKAEALYSAPCARTKLNLSGTKSVQFL